MFYKPPEYQYDKLLFLKKHCIERPMNPDINYISRYPIIFYDCLEYSIGRYIFWSCP